MNMDIFYCLSLYLYILSLGVTKNNMIHPCSIVYFRGIHVSSVHFRKSFWTRRHIHKIEPRYEKTYFMPYADVQADLRLYCSPPRYYYTSSFYIRNFKPLASLCSYAGRFESYLVANSRRQVFSWRGSNHEASWGT